MAGPHLRRGLFLTVEGGEGSGKTSLLRHLVAWHEHHGLPCLQTREPGGTPVGEELRALLLSSRRGQHMLPLTELLIILAARCEHVDKVIAPALEAGTTVLCDRYIDSTMAYQAYGRGFSPDRIWQLSTDLVPLLPDLTLYLDLAPSVGFSRVEHRQSTERDRLESESSHFHAQVREGFLAMAQRCPKRIVVLDASLPEQQLAAAAIAVVEARTRNQGE